MKTKMETNTCHFVTESRCGMSAGKGNGSHERFCCCCCCVCVCLNRKYSMFVFIKERYSTSVLRSLFPVLSKLINVIVGEACNWHQNNILSKLKSARKTIYTFTNNFYISQRDLNNLCFVFFFFIQVRLWHMEVSRSRAESELQLQPILQLWQYQIWTTSVNYGQLLETPEL